jgi:hypothetical protein
MVAKSPDSGSHRLAVRPSIRRYRSLRKAAAASRTATRTGGGTAPGLAPAVVVQPLLGGVLGTDLGPVPTRWWAAAGPRPARPGRYCFWGMDRHGRVTGAPDLDEGPIIEQDVVRADHTLRPEALAGLGRDVEAQVLARAARRHAEHRVLLNGPSTVVFT